MTGSPGMPPRRLCMIAETFGIAETFRCCSAICFHGAKGFRDHPL
jgi:hypothetical protein